MTAIAKIRNKINVPSIDSVEIVIGSRDPTYGYIGENLQANFVCVSCDHILVWAGEMFECTGCGMDLSAVEAIDICDAHSKELSKLASLAGKKAGLFQRVWLNVTRRFR